MNTNKNKFYYVKDYDLEIDTPDVKELYKAMEENEKQQKVPPCEKQDTKVFTQPPARFLRLVSVMEEIAKKFFGRISVEFDPENKNATVSVCSDFLVIDEKTIRLLHNALTFDDSILIIAEGDGIMITASLDCFE